MENGEKNTSTKTQSKKQKWTRDQIEKSLDKDLSAAISLIQIIKEDPKVFQLVVDILHERINKIAND